MAAQTITQFMDGQQQNSQFNVNAPSFVPDEKPVPLEEQSLLNKILNEKLNLLHEGDLTISKLQQDPTSPLYSNQSFDSLRLKPELIRALQMMGFHQPSKIQEASLPILLCEPHKVERAKRQPSLLTMLNRLDPTKKAPQCICLAPTFELARQIGEVAKKMARYMEGVGIRYAIKGELAPRGTVFTEQIIIGTPGKMTDWLIKYQLIDASNIICFVLDEADVMISQQGYQDQSIRLHNHIVSANPKCQCLMFSATYTEQVFDFAQKLIEDPVIISVRRQDQSLPYIKQYYVRCSTRDQKYQAIVNLYTSLTIASSIIFCYTRSSATWLATKLRESGRDVGLLHGEMPVEERARTVEEFKNGRFKVLITTNVCARLDIPQVTLIVNYDPPVTFEEVPKADHETYLHRIGRTGRFGKPGIAVNLVDSDLTMAYVKDFEQYFGRQIERLDANDALQLDSIERATFESF
ncbi:DEAD box protein/DEAH protein box helicase family protein [Aphelenchoides avenae]|nr:DEAD box protein/DEAH protein box helicase family protein [Aphelenchus avenae]